MALNPTPVGDAIAAFVQSVAPAPGTPITTVQLQQLWEGIVKIIYDDLKANLQVNPGTFAVSGVMAGGDTVAVLGEGGPAL